MGEFLLAKVFFYAKVPGANQLTSVLDLNPSNRPLDFGGREFCDLLWLGGKENRDSNVFFNHQRITTRRRNLKRTLAAVVYSYGSRKLLLAR